MRFVGGVIFCPRVEIRIGLGSEHRYGDEFVCPGCGVRIPEAPFRRRGRARA